MALKLILTQEVAGLGAPGDVVDVKGGYGRNYLLPRGLAMRWTRGAEKEVTSIRRARGVREVADIDRAKAIKTQLEALTVELRVKAGTSGRLFGSVTVADVAGAIGAAGGPAVDKRRIELGNPIKTVGSHRVTVRVHPEVNAAVSLAIVAA